MKRPGVETPAQHQIMSGGELPFQFVASVMTRAADVGFARSALMK